MPEGELKEAIKDYRFLLNRKYSRKAGLKIVGDRYMLSREQRSILYRGVSEEISAGLRKSKLTGIPREKKVYIDTYNVLFTIGNYLNGRPVFLSDDGFLRDAGELRGRFTSKKLLQRIVRLLYDFFDKNEGNDYINFIDKPVSNSGSLAKEMNTFFRKNDIKGYAETCDSPDHRIINYALPADVVCTSDSLIIDEVDCAVFDLSFHLINENFHPQIMDIGELGNGDQVRDLGI